MKKYIIVGIVIIVGAVGGAFALLRGGSTEPTTDTQEGMDAMATSTDTMNMDHGAMMHTYKDGVYSVEGPYTYHGGDEHIFMEITLADGVITAAEVTSDTTNPVSIRMIDRFKSGYKAEVIGKKIDDVKLGVVSGSSLTPIGFMAGLETVKQEAMVATN